MVGGKIFFGEMWTYLWVQCAESQPKMHGASSVRLCLFLLVTGTYISALQSQGSKEAFPQTQPKESAYFSCKTSCGVRIFAKSMRAKCKCPKSHYTYKNNDTQDHAESSMTVHFVAKAMNIDDKENDFWIRFCFLSAWVRYAKPKSCLMEGLKLRKIFKNSKDACSRAPKIYNNDYKNWKDKIYKHSIHMASMAW